MPTINVSPGDGSVLQDIADTMAKSKKVVVVTGAGISTNCGIPDFRSENGLYSLIQAQYDAAKSGNNSDTGESGPSTPNDIPMAPSGSLSSSQAAMCPRRRVGRPRKEKALLPDTTNTNTSISSQTLTTSTASDYIPLSSTPQLSKRISDIKGKDLFDSMVWNNHLSTSTFLTFIASLRRQIRNEVKETTDTHKFLRTLRDGGRLVRCYTQNIDGLEAREGLEMDLARGQGSRSRFSPTNVKEGAGQTAETVLRGGPLDGGVEVVGLHGGLSQLRCGLCQKLCDWDQIPRDEEEDSGNATGDDSSADNSQLTISSQTTEIDTNSSAAPTTPANRGTPNRRRLRNRSISLPPDTNIQLQQQIQNSCMDKGSSEEPQESSESQDSQLSAEDIFLSGSAPACPYCSAKNAKREKGGRRSLAIGRLRPDVVLYGEEHPEAHLIGPLMTHDISLSPDILLILGTSLKVHGLKVMVREFAKAVHSRGGKVVFVNRTKPPESIWGDVIDYWVEWDCDVWVNDLRERSEELWQHRGVMILNRAESRKKPKSEMKVSQMTRDDGTSGALHRDKAHGNVDQDSQSSHLPPIPKTINTTVLLTKSGKKSRPAATRDCTHNAAHHTAKIHRILRLCALSSSPPPLPPLSSISVNINRPPSPPSAKLSSLPTKWAFETKLDVQLPLPTSLPTESTRTTRSSRRSSPRLPTPPDSDPSSAQELSPRSMRRIKEKSSIQAILSSPSTSPRKRRRGN